MSPLKDEQLEATLRKLNDKINRLDQKISFLPEPFSHTSMQRVQKGGTGASRIRRIPLHNQETEEAATVATHGNFTTMSHIDLTDGSTDIVYYTGIILPTDYVAIATMQLKYMYSVSDADDTIDWVISVRSVRDGAGSSASVVSLLSDTNSVAAPPLVNTMSIRSLDFTTLPLKDDIIFTSIQRTTGDANTASVHLWAAWIEYVAFI